MKRFLMKWGVPSVVLMAVTSYYVFSGPATWTVFLLPSQPESERPWLASGFETEEDCYDYVRIFLSFEENGLEDEAKLVCGFACRTLRSHPSFKHCTQVGETRDVG